MYIENAKFEDVRSARGMVFYINNKHENDLSVFYRRHETEYGPLEHKSVIKNCECKRSALSKLFSIHKHMNFSVEKLRFEKTEQHAQSFYNEIITFMLYKEEEIHINTL
jgi:hypothetical protein